LLCGKLGLGQNASGMQPGQPLDCSDRVLMASRSLDGCRLRGPFMASVGRCTLRAGNDRQAPDVDDAELARKTKGSRSRLLLGEAADLMVLRVIDGHGPVHVDREAPAGGEIGVAHVAL